jgi:hypothetical protein
VCMGPRHALEDKGAEVVEGDKSSGEGQKGGCLGLRSAWRGQSWCPDKGGVHGPTWPSREANSRVL